MRAVIILILILSMILLEVFCKQGEVKTNKFSRLTNSMLSMKSLGLAFKVSSLTACASKCLSTDLCSSFDYQKSTGNCSLGSCLLSIGETNVNHMYSTGQMCTEYVFQHLTSGDVNIWVYFSPVERNYTAARDDCYSKSSHLYTPKTQEKLALMMKYIGVRSMWIGLADEAVEGTFVWQDDWSVLSLSQKPSFFHESANCDDPQICDYTLCYPSQNFCYPFPATYLTYYACERQ